MSPNDVLSRPIAKQACGSDVTDLAWNDSQPQAIFQSSGLFRKQFRSFGRFKQNRERQSLNYLHPVLPARYFHVNCSLTLRKQELPPFFFFHFFQKFSSFDVGFVLDDASQG